jgi:hypothetical protein
MSSTRPANYARTCRKAAKLLEAEAARQSSPFAEPLVALLRDGAVHLGARPSEPPPSGILAHVLTLAETVVELAATEPAPELQETTHG